MILEELAIVDSHIHLYAETHLSRLNWTAALPLGHTLNQQNSVEQYKFATKDCQTLSGFVFVETDRKSSHDETGWTDPLEEVAFLARIAKGFPIEGEGHSTVDSRLLLGIVPWAPLPAGSALLERYVTKVRDICGDDQTFRLVKGFRYLVQDKLEGTMLDTSFISALVWLADNGFSFDLGIDLRQGGIHQLREACDMFSQVLGSGKSLKIIINHCCKPNLCLTAQKAVQNPDFVAWSECIKTFASYPSTYMKLSGFFSELPPQDESTPTPIVQLLEQTKPWVDVVFSAFGPSRIMFGSDWPVCSAGGPGSKSWQHWAEFVTALLDERELSRQEKQQIWSGTAAEAYKLKKVT